MNRLRSVLAVICLFISTLPAGADTVRVATFNAELQRDGPGLLLRDIAAGDDAQVRAVASVIARVRPDILALQGFDWDHGNVALKAFADVLRDAGVEYPYLFSRRPNSGLATDFDMDGDGEPGGPGDSQGYGEFTGQGGLAVLSRFPIRSDRVRDYTDILWRQLPGALLPRHPDGRPFPSEQALSAQKLSSTAHWHVPVRLPGGAVLALLTFQAGPPVFDGPEDRNGRRNHDEIRLWRAILDGVFGPPPDSPFVILGGANLDPDRGEGRHEAIRSLLTDPRLQDPGPRSDGAAAAGGGAVEASALSTVDWPSVGRLRVDYVLPSRDVEVLDAGVFWPVPGAPGHRDALAASRHRLVWVDLEVR